MTNDIASRLTELETRFAHQERLSEDLSAVVAEQARTIDLLVRHVGAMADRMRDLGAGGAQQDDKPPPHY